MIDKKITLSINPTYFCNFRCSFCYLSEMELSDRKTISKELLFEKLSDISSHRAIEHIDLYGGEIALIRPEALSELIDVINVFYKGKINIISNLSHINPVFLSDRVDLSVSWDYFAREKHQLVYENMLSLNKDIHVLILASKSLLEMQDSELEDMIFLLNSMPNLASVEIKPFSDNSHHSQYTLFTDFEAFVKRWIIRSRNFNFEFINISKINDSVSGKYSSWSDEHLYITPHGEYSVLEFDKEGKEYFLKVSNFNEYEIWANKEKANVKENPFCGTCKYLGSCLSEHLQSVKSIEHSCNGFKNLLDWYEKTI